MRLRLSFIFAFAALAIAFSMGLVVGCFFSITNPTFAGFFRNPQASVWAGVFASLLVVFMALFLNIVRDHIRRPRFTVTCGTCPPYQLRTDINGSQESEELLHVRLCVKNVGRTCANACEVRLERIYSIINNGGRIELIEREDHDPRPLKWVGRDTTPIALSPGAFDFVDLGALNSQFIQNFRIEFHDRGHIDLDIGRSDVHGFRLEGTIYATDGVPKQFTFNLTWKDQANLHPVEISEA